MLRLSPCVSKGRWQPQLKHTEHHPPTSSGAKVSETPDPEDVTSSDKVMLVELFTAET